MSLGSKLNATLEEFEDRTEGILGSCVINTSQALIFAEASNNFDRGMLSAVSEKLMSFSNDTLNPLFPNFSLSSITIEEANHFIYVRKVNDEFHLVVITDKSELSGLREVNIKSVIKKLNAIFDS